MQLDVEQVVTHKFPTFTAKPVPVKRSTLFCLRHLVREHEINRFLSANTGSTGFEFIDKVLDYFNFSYTLSHQHRMNIPASGRVLIIANHPWAHSTGWPC